MTARPPAAVPRPSVAVPAERPARQTIRALRRELRERVLEARALERAVPERYGFDAAAAARLFFIPSLLYRRYFRTECHGIEHLPRGRVLLVANHGSHALAWDGASILAACLLDANPPRLVHAMADHRLMELPIVGCAARRIGAVDGRRAVCIRLLREGAAVLTFPEGTRAHEKRYRDRYQLAPFGEGFARVAMVTHTPIVPVAVIGCEEEAPLFGNPRWLRRLVRTHTAPITPTLVVPLPVRYRLYFGEPIRLGSLPNAVTIPAAVRSVREALERLIAQGLQAREHVFW
jgi:1-acyl-sn-glycerol-3-phosphate acyltransferase